jgi:hypothetical protein
MGLMRIFNVNLVNLDACVKMRVDVMIVLLMRDLILYIIARDVELNTCCSVKIAVNAHRALVDQI